MSQKSHQNKYTDGYFEHFIAMFQSPINEDGLKEHVNIYIQVEGISEFRHLIEEINSIRLNNDWGYFVDLIKEYDPEGLKLAEIQKLAEIALEINKEL